MVHQAHHGEKVVGEDCEVPAREYFGDKRLTGRAGIEKDRHPILDQARGAFGNRRFARHFEIDTLLSFGGGLSADLAYETDAALHRFHLSAFFKHGDVAANCHMRHPEPLRKFARAQHTFAPQKRKYGLVSLFGNQRCGTTHVVLKLSSQILTSMLHKCKFCASLISGRDEGGEMRVFSIAKEIRTVLPVNASFLSVRTA
jgi:hypothetical protein